MKIKKIFAAVISLCFIFQASGFVMNAEAKESVITVTDDFEAYEAGTDISECGWENVNAYKDGALNNIYTIEEDGDNNVAHLVKGPAEGNSRLWIAKGTNAPENTTSVKIEFKIRSMTQSGSVDVGFGDNGDYPSNGHIRIDFSSNLIIWRAGLGGVWTSDGHLKTGIGEWNTISITVNPTEKQGTTVRGKVYVNVNGESRGNDWMNTLGLQKPYVPASVSFGWLRQQEVGAVVEIDDLKVESYYPTPFELDESNETENIDVDNNLSVKFTNVIDNASVNSTIIGIDGESINVVSKEVDSEDNTILKLSFDKKFDFDKNYVLSISGLKDDEGKTIDTEYSFKTRKRRCDIFFDGFYKNYNTPMVQRLFSYANGTSYAKVNYNNETEAASVSAILASFKGNKLTGISAEEKNNIPQDENGDVVLSITANDSDRLVLISMDSLKSMLHSDFAELNGAEETNNKSEVAKVSEIKTVTPLQNGNKRIMDIETEAKDGSAIMYILRKGYTLANLNSQNIASAVADVNLVDIKDGHTEYDYTDVSINQSEYEFIIAIGGMEKVVKNLNPEFNKYILSVVKNSTVPHLKKLMAETTPDEFDGYIINDFLMCDLTDYNNLKDKEAVLKDIAGINFDGIKELREEFEKQVKKQKELEERIEKFITEFNSADWSDIEHLIKNNNDLLSINLDDTYKKVSSENRVIILKHIAHDYVFSTLEEIRNAFNETVETYKKYATPSPKKVSGGGGTKAPKLETKTGSLPEKVNVSKFNDLENVKWAEEAINYLTEKGIVNGCGNDKFCPEKAVKREEFVKMIVNAFNIEEKEEDVSFNDVEKNAWYSKFISSAYNKGIISGLSESEFGIGKEISRADMAVICMRIINIKNIKINIQDEEIAFSDNDEIPEYAAESVKTLAGADLLHGVSSDRFSPNKSATRAMAAKLVYDILQVGQGGQK